MKGLNDVAIMDRYTMIAERAGFYYNEDPECRKRYNLIGKRNYIVIYNGMDSRPKEYDLTGQTVEAATLTKDLHV